MPKTTEDLEVLYQSMKSLLVEFETPQPGVVLEGRSASDQDFDLWSVRDLVIEGRPRKELFFAGIRLQKSFVGFYYFPLYCLPTIAEALAPALVKLLKGKSCFHVKSLDAGLGNSIREALSLGVDRYRERGWV